MKRNRSQSSKSLSGCVSKEKKGKVEKVTVLQESIGCVSEEKEIENRLITVLQELIGCVSESEEKEKK